MRTRPGKFAYSPNNSRKKPLKKKKKKLFIKVLLIVVVLLALLFAVLQWLAPRVARYVAVNKLAAQGLQHITFEDLSWKIWRPQVTLTNLAWRDQSNHEFSAKTARLNLKWLPLMDKLVQVESLSAQDILVTIDLKQFKQREVNVGGFNINLQQSTAQNSPNGATQPKKSWSFAVDTLKLNNINFQIQGANAVHSKLPPTHLVTIRNLKLNDASTNKPKQVMTAAIDAAINEKEFKLRGEAQPFADDQSFQAHLDVNLLDIINPLSPFMPNLTGNSQATINLMVQHNMTQSGRVIETDLKFLTPQLKAQIENFTINLAEFSFNINGVTNISNDYKISTDQHLSLQSEKMQSKGHINKLIADALSENIKIAADMNIPQFDMAYIEQATGNIETTIDVGSSQINLQNAAKSESKPVNAMSFQALSTSAAVSEREGQIANLEIEDLQLAQINDEYLLSTENFNLNQLRLGKNALGQKDLTIENITLSEPQATIMINEQGNLVARIVAQELAALTTKKQTNASSTANWEWAIQKLDVKKPARVRLIDYRYGTKPLQTLNFRKLKIANLSLSNPASVELDVKSEQGGTLTANGQITLADPQANTDINAVIQQLELPPLSQLINATSGYGVETGTLDAQLAYKAQAGKGRGDLKLQVSRLDLMQNDKALAAQIASEISMPVELAIASLKNDKNIIELNVPIKVDSQSIDTSIGTVTRQALTKAIKKAVFGFTE